MECKHGWAIGDEALRRNHNYPDEPAMKIGYDY
jgi:hypothetical protein